ncbi:kynureninase [Amycolatopsis antarctica]|uniref:Kynureninase n=1 Tax=Amycolatopsis antarctica TaxID=1854586 RepID=A0A263D614_9PSEU|nr:kynureninase [Amycolatopsis antarctica]OZM73900.1 kynureninase [Amycolatopsis antarctica]
MDSVVRDLAADLSEQARELDGRDRLAGKRDEFDLDPEVAYLDGNSLGAPPLSVAPRLAEVVREQWAGRLIRSWSDGWWDAPVRVGERIAPLLGAAPGQTVVCDSTSVNLFKALVAATRINPGREEILLDAGTFPTDGYIADSVARLTGTRVRRVPMPEMAGAACPRTAVALVNHVDYRTGALADLPAVTAGLHEAGALVVWDLCHGAGAVPPDLDQSDVDIAVGCTYKFLNGGPGSPSFVYVARRLQEVFDQPLAGWGGHRDPFAMAESYEAGPGMDRARSGTPDILSLLALDAALDVWEGVDLAEVRAKGLALGDFFLHCLDELLPGTGVISPRDHARGNQISIAWPDAEATMRTLTERGVIGDFRPPDVLRFGLAPLYTRYADVLRAVLALATVRAETA